MGNLADLTKHFFEELVEKPKTQGVRKDNETYRTRTAGSRKGNEGAAPGRTLLHSPAFHRRDAARGRGYRHGDWARGQGDHGQRRTRRSEERRVGKECVSPCRSRGWQYH